MTEQLWSSVSRCCGSCFLVPLLRARLSKGSDRTSHNHNFSGNSYSFIRSARCVFHRRENRELETFQRLPHDSWREATPLPLSPDVFSEVSGTVCDAQLDAPPPNPASPSLHRCKNAHTNSCGICTPLNLIHLRPLREQRSQIACAYCCTKTTHAFSISQSLRLSSN